MWGILSDTLSWQHNKVISWHESIEVMFFNKWMINQLPSRSPPPTLPPPPTPQPPLPVSSVVLYWLGAITREDVNTSISVDKPQFVSVCLPPAALSRYDQIPSGVGVPKQTHTHLEISKRKWAFSGLVYSCAAAEWTLVNSLSHTLLRGGRRRGHWCKRPALSVALRAVLQTHWPLCHNIPYCKSYWNLDSEAWEVKYICWQTASMYVCSRTLLTWISSFVMTLNTCLCTSVCGRVWGGHRVKWVKCF